MANAEWEKVYQIKGLPVKFVWRGNPYNDLKATVEGGNRDYVTVARIVASSPISQAEAEKLAGEKWRQIKKTARNANAARNAKFKVGDRVKYVGRKNGAPYGKILTVVKEPDGIGRYVVRWDSDHKGFMAVGSEGFATEAELTAANAARSRNAVVQKAMNATGDKSKQKDWNVSRGTKGVYTAVRSHMPFDMNTWGPWYRGDFKPDRGQADTDRVRHFYDEASRERFIRDENRKNGFVVKGGEYVLSGYVPKTSWNADTSVLRETAVNGSDDAILRLCKQSNIIQRGKTENLHEVRYGGGYIYPVVSRDGVLIKVYGSLSEANRRALNSTREAAVNAKFKVGDRVGIRNYNGTTWYAKIVSIKSPSEYRVDGIGKSSGLHMDVNEVEIKYVLKKDADGDLVYTPVNSVSNGVGVFDGAYVVERTSRDGKFKVYLVNPPNKKPLAEFATREEADRFVADREKKQSSGVRTTNAVVAKALNTQAVCNAGDPGHFTSDELSALKGAFAGLNNASFSQYPNKSREQLAVRGENGILITVQKFAFDGKPVEFDIRGQGPRSGFGVKFASSIREAVTTVKRMLASAKRQSPYSFSKYD